jgi:hypothetical protein
VSRDKLIEQSQRRLNEYARSHSLDQLFRRCFGEEILPDRKIHGRKFLPQDMLGGVYISDRDGDAELREQLKVDEFPHEAYLDQLFWDPDPAHAKVFLLGDVGCGKSTLIDYYLRCYCPAKGKHPAEFESKLVILLDAIEYPDIADATENFYFFVQGVMRRECESRGVGLDALVQQHRNVPMNVRQWVLIALEQLSNPANSRGHTAPIKYIVLVIDNLDQCSVQIQKKSLAIAEGWLRAPNINLWRVFVPLWPSTWRKLRNQDFGPTRRGVRFDVGAIPIQRILEARTQTLSAELEKARATNVQADEVTDYIQGLYTLVRPRLLPRVNELCNDNLRRKLRLWNGLVRGDLALNLSRQVRETADHGRTYDYELLDAMLCGSYDAFVPDESGVANVFTMGRGHSQSRDLLVGLHALTLLDRDRLELRSSFYTALMRLGYRAEDVRAVDGALRLFNFFHEVPAHSDLDSDAELEVHRPVVQAYLKLCLEPAYLDNAALVTPVDAAVRARMVRTRGGRAEDFPARVRSTLEFINFIRAAEEEFTEAQHVDPDLRPLFIHHLPRLHIPYFWKHMLNGYRDRLQGLRRSRFRPNIEDGWWDDVLAMPLFAEAASGPAILVPRA